MEVIRMRLRWFSLVMLCCTLLLSAVPAQAALIPVSPNQPTKITSDQGLYDRLVKLRSGILPVPFSAVSPDDKAVLSIFARGGQTQLAFLNIEDGSVVPVNFAGSILTLTEFVWFNSQTLGFLGIAITEDDLLTVLATINRQTGEVKTTPVTLPGFPVTLSPGGKRLVFAVGEDGAAPQSSGSPSVKVNPLKSPFDQKVRTSLRAKPNLLKGVAAENISPVARRNILQNGLAEGDPIEATSVSAKLASLDLTTGQITPMFDVPGGTALVAAGWSRDDSQLALLRVFTSVLTSGQYSGGQFLNDLITKDALGELPPDRNPLLQGNGVDVFDFKSNTPRPNFLRAAASGGDSIFGVGWNSDNSALLVQRTRPSRLIGRANPIYFIGESAYVQFYSPDGQLTGTLDRPEVSDPTATPYFVSNDEVLLQTTVETNQWLYYYNRTSGDFRRLSTLEGYHAFPQPTRASRQVIYHFSSFGQAPEIFRQNWDGSAPVALTNINAEVNQFGKVRYDPVSFTLANGQKRTGYLLQAANATFPPRNKRIIVWQEGGPPTGVWNQWGDIVERPFNLLPNNDFALLFVPLTGRYGYGVERYKALYQNKAFGSADIDEQAEIVRQMISQGWTSQGSVGITGCSYGGYFATQSSIRHPSLYSAVNAQCTLTDMFTEAQFDQTAAFFYIMGTSFTADPTYYKQVSPLFNASGVVRAPTLLFHGTEDFIPIRTAVNYHDQLQRNGIAINLMGFIGEGHGLAFAPNQLIAAQAQVEWFRQYLQNPAPAVPASNGN
jgi:dipeptidyl aminopeptidase/acylaminoacyl peptidase